MGNHVHVVGLAARFGRLTSPGLSTMLNTAVDLGATTAFSGSANYQAYVNQLADWRGRNEHRKLVLAGYSLGAMRAVLLAEELWKREVPVDLVYLLVPAYALIPENVKRCVNHTVVGGRFLLWPSDRVDARDPKKTTLRNIDHGSILGMTHISIQFQESVHREWASEIEFLLEAPAA